MDDELKGDELKGLVGGLRLAFAGVGVITTLAAIATEQGVVILNTIGVAGLGMVVIGGYVWVSSKASDPLKPVRNTALAVSVTGLIGALLFFTGRPLDEEEKEPGFLTVLGVLTVIMCATLLSLGLSYYKRQNAPKMKQCPECANEVLAEARKCQYCQHRFDVP
jgi:hypothetical protein